jgi:hypothetical protein
MIHITKEGFSVPTGPPSMSASDAFGDWPLQRLLSHHLIGGVVVFGLWLVSEPLALFTALVLYAHVLGDLVWDNYLLETYREQHAMAAESVSGSDSDSG